MRKRIERKKSEYVAEMCICPTCGVRHFKKKKK
jgi:hypothetical protein